MKSISILKSAAYSIFMMMVCLFVVNLAAGIFIKRVTNSNSKYEAKAIPASGAPDYLVCHEWSGNQYFDFYFQDVLSQYRSIINIGAENIDSTQPIKCVRHQFDATKIMMDLPVPGKKKKGAKRLVFIGDSFTYGEAVPRGAAYPDAINNYLRLLGNPDNWEIVNYGIIGADMPFIYEKNFKDALKTNPDAIVYTWIPNDTPYGGKREEFLRLNDLINRRNLILRTKGISLIKLISTASTNRRLTRDTLKWYQDVNGPNNKEIERFSEALSKMKRESEARGVDFRVALFPILAGKPGRYPLARAHKYIGGILHRENIKYIDLTHSVLRLPADKLWICPANHHPNVQMHRWAAKALMQYLSIKTSYKRNKPASANKIEQKSKECDNTAAAGISAYTLRTLRKEAEGIAPEISIITNSGQIKNALLRARNINVRLAEKGADAAAQCAHGRPCLYLLFIPEKIKHKIYLPDFDPPVFSKLTFTEGVFLFMFPDDAASLPAWITLYGKDLCEWK